jgi:putative membrane-bound dehydrogenase-like protein
MLYLFKKLTIIIGCFVLLYCIACKQPATDSSPIGLYVPDDLEVSLWAESPMLYNPTNMDVDARGRIWVTEAVNYRNFNNDSTKFLHYQKGDRVIILEDRNQDGKADTSIVFVQDSLLIAPLGIAVIDNKVIVSCAPNLIIYTDENNDDHADKREIFLTGFGGKDHDHALHSVVAGPDGRWYFNTGNAGPHQVKDKAGWNLRSGSMYTGGTPYNDKNEGNQKSDDGKVWVGGLALRINADGTGLTVLGHNFRNSYEVVTDSYGNLWQNDNDDQVTTCRTSWLMEGGNAGYFSIDGTRSWQADQRPGQNMFTAHWHQDDPGTMPAGDQSGAGAPTGIVVNESDVLGEKYRGLLLSADAGRNIIFGYTPQLKKSGYDLGARSNFITSLKKDTGLYVWNDTTENKRSEKWFRPSDVCIGTDGAIYVADWYDPVVGGHQMQDSTGYGRIYRITPKNKKLVVPLVDLSTTAGQIAALKNPAINVRNLGFEKLREQGEAVLPDLQPLLNDPNGYIQARATFLMSQLGEKGKSLVAGLLENKNELIRATAFRALRRVTDSILPYAQKLANDGSPFVRREVAIAIRDWPYEKKKPLLLAIAKQYDGEDRWYLETLGAAMEKEAQNWYADLVTTTGVPASKWNTVTTNFTWRLHPVTAIGSIAERVSDSTLPITERKKMLTALAYINHKDAVSAMIQFTKNNDKNIAEDAAYWASFRQSNDWASLYDWSKSGINAAYERKLAEMKIKMQKMLDTGLPTDERKWNAQDMAADAIGGQMLIGLVAENKLPSVVVPFVEAAIFNNPDITIRSQASKHFKRKGVDKIFAVDAIAQLQGDETAGKQVYIKNCATCHKAGEEGKEIGPDLTSIKNKFDRNALLDAIINPNAALVFGYEPWLVTTKEGQSVYGFLLSETKKNMVLKDINGQKHVIAANSISKKEKQSASMMPEPITMGLTEKDLANVTEFLLRLKGKE